MSYKDNYFCSVSQTQLTSRLQESPSKQEVEDESRRTRSLSAVSDCSQSFQSMSSSSSSKKQQQQSPVEDPVVSATLRQLQHLGVHVDEDVLTESGKNHRKAVETARYWNASHGYVSASQIIGKFPGKTWSCLERWHTLMKLLSFLEICLNLLNPPLKCDYSVLGPANRVSVLYASLLLLSSWLLKPNISQRTIWHRQLQKKSKMVKCGLINIRSLFHVSKWLL